MSVGTKLKPQTKKRLLTREQAKARLAANVDQILKGIGKNELWLSRELGVFPSRMTKLMSGLSVSGADFVANLAIVLGVSCDQLLGVQPLPSRSKENAAS